MPRTFRIHKPTHRFHDADRLLAIGQMRGDLLILNRFDENGDLIEKSWAVGTCAYHLTGYGQGVKPNEALSLDHMEGAWRFTFGVDPATPTRCEVVNA